VNANELDERTVEMTRELIEIFNTVQQQQSSSSNMGISEDNNKKRNLLDWQSLDQQELNALSRILIRKIFWDRRTNVLRSSNRIL
jgi:hypothetical protein